MNRVTDFEDSIPRRNHATPLPLPAHLVQRPVGQCTGASAECPAFPPDCPKFDGLCAKMREACPTFGPRCLEKQAVCPKRRVACGMVPNRRPRRHIIAGELFAARRPTEISTSLGSCVAACLFDPESKIGGMNHFMLPARTLNEGASARYGVHAMELLINEIMKRGGDRRRLRARRSAEEGCFAAWTLP